MALQFNPLHRSFGAEVAGFDCNQDVVQNTEALKAALTEWQLLLFRNQDLTDGAFVEFCRAFGDLELLPERKSVVRISGNLQSFQHSTRRQ